MIGDQRPRVKHSLKAVDPLRASKHNVNSQTNPSEVKEVNPGILRFLANF